MIRKEMIAMLLAGGQGSRLGVLTAKVAKPAVAFGGKYRIIDFPLTVVALLIRWKNRYTAIVTVKIPRNTNSDMGI